MGSGPVTFVQDPPPSVDENIWKRGEPPGEPEPVPAMTVSGFVHDTPIADMFVPFNVDVPFAANHLLPPLVVLYTLFAPAYNTFGLDGEIIKGAIKLAFEAPVANPFVIDEKEKPPSTDFDMVRYTYSSYIIELFVGSMAQ